MLKPSVALLTSLVLFPITMFAADKSLTAKITAVDLDKKSITVDDFVLDVTRKTKIAVDGKQATLGDIKTGEQAKVTYDDELEVATSVIVGKEPEGDDDATAKAMKALQGEWLCIQTEEVGESLDKKTVKEQDRRVTIKGNSYAMNRTKIGDKRTGYVGKFEIDASKGYFDFVGKGPLGNLVEWIGLYELDGDTLKICYRYNKDGNAERPKRFKTDKEKGNISVFYTLKRDND